MPHILMSRAGRILLAIAALAAAAQPASAQAPPSRIPWFVLDLHGTFTRFPDTPALAASRGLQSLELPGGGFGVDAALHLYPLRWKAITFGIGAQVTAARAHQQPDPAAVAALN